MEVLDENDIFCVYVSIIMVYLLLLPRTGGMIVPDFKV